MKTLKLGLIVFTLVGLAGLAACDDSSPTNPNPQPSPASMTFKQGARYEYQSYHTDADNGQRTDSTARRRTWTLTSANATAYSRSNVAIYVDSVFNTGGGFVSVSDTVYLQQQSGTNDIYRYASLAPELDLSGVELLDLGRDWRQEARLNATAVNWLVGKVTQPVTADIGVPGLGSFDVVISDSAVASTNETVTIGGRSYVTTKTTHRLTLALETKLGPLPIKLASTSLTRTTWISAELGAIVKEVREGARLTAPWQGQSYSIAVPGYYSEMTTVLSTGG